MTCEIELGYVWLMLIVSVCAEVENMHGGELVSLVTSYCCLHTWHKENCLFVRMQLHLAGNPFTIKVSEPPPFLIVLISVLICWAHKRDAEISLSLLTVCLAGLSCGGCCKSYSFFKLKFNFKVLHCEYLINFQSRELHTFFYMNQVAKFNLIPLKSLIHNWVLSLLGISFWDWNRLEIRTDLDSRQ